MKNIEFSVGNQYKARKGIYTVIDVISPKKMRVKYGDNGNDFDGKELDVDIEFQRRMTANVKREPEENNIHKNVKKMSDIDKIKRHRKRVLKINTLINSHISSETTAISKKFFRTIGYLARNGCMYAFMPDKYAEVFESKYKDITGKMPDGHVIHITKSNGELRKWGVELRISYNLPDGIESKDIELGPFNGYVEPVAGSGHEYNINNNDFCWYLFSLGFEIGKDHEINAIIDNVPDEYVEEFKKGYWGTPV